MESCLSWAEQKVSNFSLEAIKGKFFYENAILCKSEIRCLENYGFEVFKAKPFDSAKKTFSATISWKNAYCNGLPLVVYDHIHGLNEDKPFYWPCNYAQLLYVVSSKANLKK